MAVTLLHKRSATPAKVPLTSDLSLGELSINTYDGKLYLKKDNGSASIVEIGPVYSVAGRTGAITLDVTDISGAAPLASPALTGTPSSTTAAADTNSTRIATTAFVIGQASSSNPVMNGTVAIGTSLRYARADHVHASDTSRLALSGGTLTGALTLRAGSTGAGTAPLYFQAGSLLSSATAHALEWDGTDLWITQSTPTRKQIAYRDSQLSVSQFNSGTDADSTTFWRGDGTWAAIATASESDTLQTVTARGATSNVATIALTGGTSSTSPTTGTLVVTGGVGVTGDTHIGLNTGATNTILYPLNLYRNTTSTAATGIGVGLKLITENASGTNITGSQIESLSTNVTASSEAFDLVFKTMSAGTLSEQIRISGGSQIGFGGSTSTSISLPTTNTLAISTSGSEAIRYLPSGVMVSGHTNSIANSVGSSRVQIHGTTAATASLALTRWSSGPGQKSFVILARSAGTSAGTRGAVAASDGLGDIAFDGDDGTDFISAARISGFADGTVSTGVMPGRLVFLTTPSGSGTLAERMRIDAAGSVIVGSGEASATVSGGTIRAPDRTGSNAAGTNLTIAAGNGTGTGGSGSIIFNTSPTGSTGSAANTPNAVLTLTNTRQAIFGSGHLSGTVSGGTITAPWSSGSNVAGSGLTIQGGAGTGTGGGGSIVFQTSPAGSTGSTQNTQTTALTIANTGIITVAANTAASSSSTGALIVTGGIGVGAASNIGGVLTLSSNTTSTSNTTGSLVVTGGAGISGALFAGGAIRTNSTTTSSSVTTGALISDGGLGVAGTATIGGVVTLTSATASSSVSTGALVLSGASAGLGVAGAIFAGGAIRTTANTTSTSTSTGSLIAGGGMGVAGAAFIGGVTTITSATASTNVSSGALVLSGSSAGLGVAGNGFFGGSLVTGTGEGTGTVGGGVVRAPSAAGTNIAGAGLTIQGGNSTGTGAGGSIVFQTAPAGSSGSSANTQTTALTIASTGVVTANVNVASTSSSTGSIVSAGGLGVSGAIFAGGAIRTNSTTTSSSVSTGALISDGGLGVAGTATIGGIVTLTSATASTSVSTGALVLSGASGGLGVAGAIFAGGTIRSTATTTSSSTSTGAIISNGGLGVAGQATINNISVTASTTSSSTSTGAVVVAGGVGVGGALYVGSDLSVAGNLIINGTTTTVNATTVTLDDPIITLGGDTAPGSDDNKDRGVEFRWHNGTTAKVGFFGFDDSTGNFVFIPDATNTSEVFSGTSGTIAANINGNVTSSNVTITGGSIDGVTLDGGTY